MHSFLLENIELVVGVLFLLLVVLIIMLMVNIVHTNNLREKFSFFMKGKNGKSIEQSMAECLDEVARVERDYSQLKRYTKDVIEIKTNAGLYKHHMKRYDAFEGMGGELSFVWVLLDENDDGYILNNVQGRDNAHMYSKKVEAGHCKQRLAPEEEQALAETIQKWSKKSNV